MNVLIVIDIRQDPPSFPIFGLAPDRTRIERDVETICEAVKRSCSVVIYRTANRKSVVTRSWNFESSSSDCFDP